MLRGTELALATAIFATLPFQAAGAEPTAKRRMRINRANDATGPTGGCRRALAWVFAAGALLAAPAIAHPGSGIVVDRLGQVCFVDMVSGVWRLDAHGALTHIPGPAFHWMALDAGDRFGTTALPSGPSGEFARIGTNPALLLASDFPIAIGHDGNLYYPSRSGGASVRILRLSPAGRSSTLAILPAATARGPLRYLNGLAAGPDASVYYTEDDAVRRVDGEGRLSTVVENVSNRACAPMPKGARRNPMLQGLDTDASGNIYVAATGCKSVLKVSPTGRVTLLPQVKTPWAPTGVAVSGGDLYVLEFQSADSDDRREMVPRVRKIASDGTTAIVTTVTRH